MQVQHQYSLRWNSLKVEFENSIRRLSFLYHQLDIKIAWINLKYFENAWSCPLIMVISPCRRLWCPKCWNFWCWSACKKSSWSLANLLFWVSLTCKLDIVFPHKLLKNLLGLWGHRKLNKHSSCFGWDIAKIL